LYVCLLLATIAVGYGQQREPQLDPHRQYEELERINREGRQSQANQASGEDVRGREEWFYFQRRYPYDMIPAGMRTAAIRQMKEAEQRVALARTKKGGAALLAAPVWENIGPSNFSGRVRALGIHPTIPEILYIGAAAGGVWQTRDGGEHWMTTFDTLSALAMGAIAIDYGNPDIIYAGTGENTANIDAYLGDGIFKSTDGGITWKNIGLTNVQGFSKLYVHRQKSNVIYAAAAAASARGSSGGGFYRSEDAGATWTRVVNGEIWDMTVDPGNSDRVFITLSNSVRRSTDGGKTFTTITTGLNLSSAVRLSIGLAAAEPDRLYILAARNGGSNGNNIGEVYVTYNAGTEWELKSTLPTSFFNNQGWYDNCIGVSPEDPEVVLVGGIDVLRSGDGGATWANTTKSYQGGNVHADQHIIEFDPANSGVVYLGNDGGVYTSFDAGASWQKISTVLPTSQYYAIEVDQTNQYRVYGGTQDNGTHGAYGTSSYTQTWASILGGDGFYVVVDLSDPGIIYAENFNGTPLYRIDAMNLGTRSRIDYSISPTSETGDYGNWSTPIAMSPADKKSLYTGRTALYRTSNRGSSWQKLVPGNSAKISAIGLSPHDAGKMIIGTTTGDLRFSVNDGADWAASKVAGGGAGRFVTDLVYDPVDPNRVYLTVSGSSGTRVYRSDDNGANFASISANLPNTPANAIAIDPQNNAHIFVGTDIGVFATVDGGNYWGPMNDGLAVVPVIDLKIQLASRSLIAGTHGRSMFRTSIDGVTVAPGLIYPIGNETIATPGPLEIRWAGFDGPVNVFISYDGVNYNQIGTSVSGTSLSIDLPLVQTVHARVRVVDAGDPSRSAESGDFTLKAVINGAEQTSRGFIAEAIEVRGSTLWATVRGSDSLYVLRLPLLSNRVGLVRTNIPGHVRDMAYDSVADLFYMLVAADDFSAPRVYRMDTNGVGLGEITLPAGITRLNGSAMVGENIALITPGADARIVLIDTSGAQVGELGPLVGGSVAEDRRSLVWDGLGYVQGVVERDTTVMFPSKLQILSSGNPLRIRESTPVVLPTVQRLNFVGLAFDPDNADIGQRIYWATDTSGQFFKFTRQAFFTSGVGAIPAPTTGARAGDLAIREIAPNPTRGESTIHLTVRGRHDVSIELYDVAGSRQLELFNGVMEPGDHTIDMHGGSLPSGIYYLVVSGGAGNRDVRTVVMIR